MSNLLINYRREELLRIFSLFSYELFINKNMLKNARKNL